MDAFDGLAEVILKLTNEVNNLEQADKAVKMLEKLTALKMKYLNIG